MQAALLSHALRLFNARQVGLVFGTDESSERFLPPAQWTKGVIDRFDGAGMLGMVYRFLGPTIMKWRGFSPVNLFERNTLGELIPADGITAYALRNHKAFYDQGIKILLAEKAAGRDLNSDEGEPCDALFHISTYDGRRFSTLNDVRINDAIVTRFNADNFVAAYVPDYGAIVFNTVQAETLVDPEGRFIYDTFLKSRLDHLTEAIEAASLAYLAKARGRRQ